MRVAIITDDGETPIQSADLADAIAQRLAPLTRAATRGAIRRAIAELTEEVKAQTVNLGPQHR